MHVPKWRASHALRAEIGPAIAVDRLSDDVTGARSAQESHGGRDVLRAAALAGDGLVGEMMGRLRLVLGPRRANQAGDDAIDGDAVGGKIVGQRAGEAD